MKNLQPDPASGLRPRRLCVGRALLLVALLSLNGCVVAAAAGAVVGATVEVVKIPFKVIGAAVDVAVPGGG